MGKLNFAFIFNVENSSALYILWKLCARIFFSKWHALSHLTFSKMQRLLHLESRHSCKHQVSESFSHSHTSPSCWWHQPFDWLLAYCRGCSLEAERRQGNNSYISQWSVKRTHTLLLSNQTSHRSINLEQRVLGKMDCI